jgi:hypothetical protein
MNWYELKFSVINDNYDFKSNHLLVEAKTLSEALDIYKTNMYNYTFLRDVINISKIDYVKKQLSVNCWYEFEISGGGGRPGHWGDNHLMISSTDIENAIKSYLCYGNISGITKISQIYNVLDIELQERLSKGEK